MIIHIGADAVIEDKKLIAILDADAVHHSKEMRLFIESVKKNGNLIDISEDLCRSYVITSDPERNIYASPISSSTLQLRVNQFGTVRAPE